MLGRNRRRFVSESDPLREGELFRASALIQLVLRGKLSPIREIRAKDPRELLASLGKTLPHQLSEYAVVAARQLAGSVRCDAQERRGQFRFRSEHVRGNVSQILDVMMKLSEKSE